MAIEVGQQAPDFTLKRESGEEIRLSEACQKQVVVLAFYCFAFSGG